MSADPDKNRVLLAISGARQASTAIRTIHDRAIFACPWAMVSPKTWAV